MLDWVVKRDSLEKDLQVWIPSDYRDFPPSLIIEQQLVVYLFYQGF